MEICEDCKEELVGHVCKNCGLVSEEKELVSLVIRTPNNNRHDPEIEIPFSYPLSVGIEYRQYRPQSSTNFELNKALRRQNQKRKKSADDYYARAHVDIKTKCKQMRLPNVVVFECFNLVRVLIGVKKTYFMHNRADYRYLALIRIACRICNIYLDERELVQACVFYYNKPINMRNSPIKKNIDREMMIIKKELNLRFKRPKNPKFISHACNVLNINQEDETGLYELYAKINNRFKVIYKLNGYLLGMIYLLHGKKYKIGLGRLETEFGIARDTVRSRKKEIEVLLK